MKNKFLRISILGLTLGVFSQNSRAASTAPHKVKMSVTKDGFEPSIIKVRSDKETILLVTRKTDSTCALTIQVPSLKLREDLPLNQEVKINLGKLAKGEIKFGCGMGMMIGGVVLVE